MSLPHQDWEPVILKKTEKKTFQPQKPGNKAFKKVDGDDPDAPKTVGMSLGKKIQQARNDKKMTQKELAQKINVKPEVIRNYEAGTAIPTSQINYKISQALGIKLN